MKFTDLMDECGVPYKEHGQHHHVTAGFVGVDCPWCSPSSGKFRMGYNLAKRFTTCWTCGPQPLVQTVAMLTGKSNKECYDLVGGIDFQKWVGTRITGKLVMPKGVVDLLPSHRRYLKSRGFDPDEVARLWRVQGFGRLGDHPHALFIPIYYGGEMVSWTTRACSEKVAKRYHTARPDQEKVAAKSLLYGEDYCGHSVVVCEGPTDVWRIGPGAVCTLGLSYSSEQVNRLAKYQRVIVCFDGSPAAQRRADKLAETLATLAPDVLRVALTSKDPATAPERRIREIRRMIDG